MNKLEELFNTYAYDSRQKNQLRIADEKGLDLERIKDPKYDWQQMREIIIAMEYGIDPKPLCDPSLSSETMESLRNHLFEQQGVYDQAKETVQTIHLKRIVITVSFFVFVVLFIGLCVINKDYIIGMSEDVPLVLKTDHIELEYGEQIHLRDYVKSYNKDQELIIPKLQDMSKLKDYSYIYVVSNKYKQTKKTLTVRLVDTVKPNISLKSNNISITQGDLFEPSKYIEYVNDNHDSLSINDVSIDDKVKPTTPGNYTVVYSIHDSSKNHNSVTLNVMVNKKVEANNQTNSTKTESSKPSENSNSNSIIKTKPETKCFYISAYNYDIAKCKSDAIQYMNESISKYKGALIGNVESFQENGTTKGYKVSFN